VIPAHDEGLRLPRTLATLEREVARRRLSLELIVVDDGSTDSTAGVARDAADRLDWVDVVSHPTQLGKGAAVRSGVARAHAPVVAFTDADLAYPVDAIVRVADQVEQGADIAIGERDDTYRGSWSRRGGSTVFNRFASGLLGLDSPDTQCGLKAFRREVAQALFEPLSTVGYAFDVEVLWLARRWELQTARVRVRMLDNPRTSVRLVRDGVFMGLDVARLWWRDRTGQCPKSPFTPNG
jgi:glycosyltransferase involved in cell wall biosynthesis